ncbi:MAG TPA: histidine kinase dimerization/phospho-acceptor domain-containing protein, partial [Acidobacteriota bacterium]|nr:histidine kinase dimerization/phospho-acceptor domain-containing protein [Acidobacteriota bacterium]
MPDQESTQPPPSSVALERRVAELTILYEVSRALQRTVDEEKALNIILHGVTSGRGLGFDRAFILLIDADAKFLEGRAAVGPSSSEEATRIWQELREMHRALGDLLNSLDSLAVNKDLRVNDIVRSFHIPLTQTSDPLLRVMKSREAARAQHGVFEPHGLPIGPLLEEQLGVESFAVAPLYLADRELGVLIADNAITHSLIDMTSLRLLQIYAQEASSAIQNTRLYRELMEKIAVCEQVNLTLRESQHHLLQSERLSTIGKMAALLAHEIRTPLVSIGGFARRMLRSAPEDDARREEMEIIVSEVRRLEKLVDEVLGYSRISKPEYKPTDVNAVIRRVILTLQDELQRNSVHAELDLHPDLPMADADEDQLRQALMNLVTNA